MARFLNTPLAILAGIMLIGQSRGDVVLASNLGLGYEGTTPASRGTTLSSGTYLAQAFTSGGKTSSSVEYF